MEIKLKFYISDISVILGYFSEINNAAIVLDSKRKFISNFEITNGWKFTAFTEVNFEELKKTNRLSSNLIDRLEWIFNN